ncbi:MAG: hypothetical protein IH604_14435 [Burkholderiales bacterium]|nr:hypothetical protein [Burkholderiales bacterium]
MKIIINATELTFKSTAQLTAMIGEVLQCLRSMDASSPEYAAAMYSLQILKRALAARRMSGPKF